MSNYIKDLREKIGHDPIFMPATGAIIYKNGKVLLQYQNHDKVYTISIFFLIEEFEGEPKADGNEVLELKWFDINKLPENIYGLDKYAIYDFQKYLGKNGTIVN